MNNINNMGGILFAEILNTDEIALFAVHQNQACIRSKEGHDWYPLPTRGVIEAPTVASDDTKDAGITYKHSATIQFPRSALEGNTANAIKFRQAVFYAVRTHRDTSISMARMNTHSSEP